MGGIPPCPAAGVLRSPLKRRLDSQGTHVVEDQLAIKDAVRVLRAFGDGSGERGRYDQISQVVSPLECRAHDRPEELASRQAGLRSQVIQRDRSPLPERWTP